MDTVEASVVARPYSPTNSDEGSDYDSDVTPFRSVGSLSPRSPLLRLSETMDLTPNSVASASPVNGTWHDSPLPPVASPVAHAALSPSSKAKYNSRLERLTRNDRVAIAFDLEEYADKESKNDTSIPVSKNFATNDESTVTSSTSTSFVTRIMQLLSVVMSVWIVCNFSNTNTVEVQSKNHKSIISPSSVTVTGGLGQLTITTNDFFQVQPKHIQDFQKMNFLTKMNEIATDATIRATSSAGAVKPSQPITIIAKKSNIMKIARYSGALTHTWEVNNENNLLSRKTKVVTLPSNEPIPKPTHVVLGDIFAQTSLHMNLLLNNKSNKIIPIKLLHAKMMRSRRQYQGPIGNTAASRYPGHIEHAMNGPMIFIHRKTDIIKDTAQTMNTNMNMQMKVSETETSLETLFKTTSMHMHMHMHMRSMKHLELPCRLIDANMEIESVSRPRVIQGPMLPFHSKHGHIDRVASTSTTPMPIVNVITLNELPCKLVHVELSTKIKSTEKMMMKMKVYAYQGPMRSSISALKNMNKVYYSGGGNIDYIDIAENENENEDENEVVRSIQISNNKSNL